MGTDIVDRPEKNARNVSEEGWEELNETVTVDPGLRLWTPIFSGGNALAAKGGLEGGQVTMKDDARVNTSFKLNGV
jgi:hypothetical protein